MAIKPEDTETENVRFDAETYTHYDEADLRAIRGFNDNQGVFREDADGIMFARQLDFVKSRTYERKYPAMMGAALVPDSTDAPEWAETITTRTFDEVGVAKIISNYADDLPRADVRAVEGTVRVRTLGDAYGYNINEIRASRALGAGLDTRKAAAARRAVEQKLNRIKFSGDADYGLIGLINHPNIAEVIGLNGDWENPLTTGTEILDDMTAMYLAVINQSYGVHQPNTFALTSTAYAAASTKSLPGFPGQTPMSFFRNSHPEIAFIQVFEFTGAGEAGADLAMLYERSEENLRHELVMPFNQLPPQERNLEFVVNCMARSAGVQIDYPLAFTKGSI